MEAIIGFTIKVRDWQDAFYAVYENVRLMEKKRPSIRTAYPSSVGLIFPRVCQDDDVLEPHADLEQ